MKVRHVIHALVCCSTVIIASAYNSSSAGSGMRTALDASDAAQPVAGAPDAGASDALPPPAAKPPSYPMYSFIKSCPPGIEESETISCPTIMLTAEQVEGIEKASKADRKYSASCPAGMREVSGTYCKSVSHTCLSCRPMMMADGHVETCYFCDKYAVGSAVCDAKSGSKQIRVCVDEYEYPNVPGKNPVIMTSWYDAHRICKSEGKRLCTDEEWTQACEGPEHKPYPYGWERDANACNIDNQGKRNDQTDQKLFQGGNVRKAELARLWNARPIAASPRCVSDYGVYDMAGNVDEVTDNVSRGGHPYKDLWKGGHWVGGARNRCRPYTDGHNEGFGYYANGFRCCADPKAASPAK